MDYRTIRTDLVNSLEYSDDYLRTQVMDLIKRLDEKIEEDARCISMSRAGSVLSEYKIDYETNIKEFLEMTRNNTDMLVKMNKAREIIAIIDVISYYIDWVISRYKGSDKSALTFINQLKNDKETFKNSSYKWTAMIASFSAEVKFHIGDNDDTEQ